MSVFPANYGVTKDIREELEHIFQIWYSNDFNRADIREKYHFLSLVQSYVTEELDELREELENN